MTGTAKSAAAEFYEIYALRVVPIPTNKPPRRKDMPLRLYYTDKVCSVFGNVFPSHDSQAN
jgi:preprotein translocase subunit SecA